VTGSRTPAVRLRHLAAPLFALTVSLAAASPAAASPAGASTGHPTPTIVDTARGHGTVVSYTFDDGPNPVDTPRLLAVLRARHVRAVFCVQGDHAREYPALVRRIAAEGHLLCNHSLKHDDLGTWTVDQIRADLLATNAADWEPPGSDELVRRLMDGITPGAVVLMHDGGGDRSQSVEAVDRTIPLLRAAGYRFTLPARG
jgi:peptidoglycan-N-acetylglucosamine deacetylase